MRILGIVFLILACLTLGTAAEYFDKEGITLVSEYEIRFGGVYD